MALAPVGSGLRMSQIGKGNVAAMVQAQGIRAQRQTAQEGLEKDKLQFGLEQEQKASQFKSKQESDPFGFVSQGYADAYNAPPEERPEAMRQAVIRERIMKPAQIAIGRWKRVSNDPSSGKQIDLKPEPTQVDLTYISSKLTKPKWWASEEDKINFKADIKAAVNAHPDQGKLHEITKQQIADVYYARLEGQDFDPSNVDTSLATIIVPTVMIDLKTLRSKKIPKHAAEQAGLGKAAESIVKDVKTGKPGKAKLPKKILENIKKLNKKQRVIVEYLLKKPNDPDAEASKAKLIKSGLVLKDYGLE